MADIADLYIDGVMCSYCSCLFVDKTGDKPNYIHDYPVLCKGCWDESTTGEREGYSRAVADRLKGGG